jgi:UDP-glucose 4-epimerase
MPRGANAAGDGHLRYLITGGAGFIGSHLADALLASGHSVRVLDDLSAGTRANLSPRANLLVGDVADPDTVADALAGMDGCFHLAAIASVQRATEDWAGTHRVNLGGTIAVLNAARALGRVPVVYASSAAVYGDLAGAVATEYARCAPQTAYGADKLGSELHASVAWRIHAIPTLGLRFFNVYGPRQSPASPYSGVISIFADRLAAGLPITRNGDGMQTRDFVHVSDVVSHLRAAMRVLRARPGAGVLNVCTGRETSIAALASILGDVLGVPPVVNHGTARPGDIGRSVGDPTRAIAALGVTAGVTLRDGLTRLRPAALLAAG